MVGIGGKMVLDGSLPIGTVAFFVLTLSNLFEPVQQLSQLFKHRPVLGGGAPQALRAARHRGRPRRAARRGRHSPSGGAARRGGCRSATARAPSCSTTWTSCCRPGRSSPSSGPPVRASRRSPS
ncbi:MAG: hypothetical protein R2711_05475 [Acidimicrobiales bacterium]